MSTSVQEKEFIAKQTWRFDLALRLLMKKFDVTQKGVATISGVSLGFINDIFHGRKRQLSRKSADQISKAFPDINGTALFILADLSDNPLIMEIRGNLISRLGLSDID